MHIRNQIFAIPNMVTKVLTLALMSLFAFSMSAHAIDIKEVKTKSGIQAYLVEDYTLPIIAMSFSFEGGSTQDPEGKEGTLRLMTSLLDEGAGDLDNVAFQSRMEELGISLGFSASVDSFSGSLRTVRDDLDSAVELMELAVKKPRFDTDDMERMRDAMRTNLIRSQPNPDYQARLAFLKTLFDGHQYARSTQGNLDSIDKITRDDLLAMNEKIMSRETLKIGVVGAISEEELANVIDRIFGDLPEASQLEKIEDVKPNLGEEVVIEMPTPNASIQLVYNGIKRSDPDFFAAHLMNHILGGGSFSSRLYQEVREKRGLAYGVYSGISTFDNSEFFSAGTSTRADNADEALKIIREEIARIAEEGVTQEELDKAKKFVAGSYAIANLDTSGKIARVLVSLQKENLGIDYIDTREDQIAAVKLEDVNRMAKELLSVEPTIIIVKPEEATQ